MRLTTRFLTLSAILATSVSCNKEQLTPNRPGITGSESTIGVAINQPYSKVGYSPDENGGIKLNWEENDSITIYTASGVKYADYGVVNIDSVANSATFKGAALTVGEEYVAVYPKSESQTLKDRDDSEPILLTQEGTQDFNYLDDNCRMKSAFAYDSTQVVSFSHEMALLTVCHTTPITPLSVSVDQKTASGDKQSRVIVKESEIDSTLVDKVSLLVYPRKAGEDLSITIYSMDGYGYVLDKKDSDKEMVAGKCYTAEVGDYRTLPTTIDKTNDFELLRQSCIADLISQNELKMFKEEYAQKLEADGMTELAQSLRSNGELNEEGIYERWKSMKTDGSWDDVDYQSQQASGWPPGNHLAHVLDLCIMYRTPNSRYFNNPELLADIIKAYKYWTDRDFYCTTNWFPRQISVPKKILQILIMLGDEVPAAVKTKALAIAARSPYETGDAAASGANKVSLATNHLYKGIVMKSDAHIVDAMAGLKSRIRMVNIGEEGLQADYTYHQHGALLQTGNYGRAQSELMAGWFNSFYGTKYAFPEDRIAIIRNFLLGSVNSSVFNGELDIQGLGRQLGENRMSDRAKSFAIYMVEMMRVDPAHQAEYEDYIYRNFRKPLVNTLVGNHYFDCSKYMMHRTDKAMVGIRMVSDIIYGGERCNDENLEGFFLGDGAVHTYQNPLSYENIYFVWNPYNIPGTTVNSSKNQPNWGNSVVYTQAADFVGAVSDRGEYGVAAMEYDRWRVTGNKAYFCMGSQVVCLGNNITCSIGDCHTTVEQNMFRDGFEYYYRDAVTTGTIGTESVTTQIISDGVGYQSLDGQEIEFKVAKADGNKNRPKKSADDIPMSDTLFTAVISHDSPSAASTASYAYMIETNADRDVFFDQERKLGFDIASNTSTVSAVENRDKGVGMYIFWKAGTIDSRIYGEIKADQPLILLVKGDAANFASECSNPLKGGATSYSIGGVAQ